jgi:ribosomal protein S18 acetylase RimI-like enzyme
VTEQGLELRRGIPPTQLDRASALLCEAFGAKWRSFVPDEQLEALVAATVSPADAIVALERGALVGVLGVRFGPRSFYRPEAAVFLRRLGPLRGLVALAVFAGMASVHRRPDELYIDALAVAGEWRGRGIGSRLLAEAEAWAREQGLAGLRLDVVDTNPRARLLYTRCGFVAGRTARYPGLRRLMGFSASTTMAKPVACE